MKQTPQLHAARRVYVATGPDSDIYAGEVAKLSKPTPWGAQLVRHKANCTRVEGRCATYVELAQVDFEVCREAAWFVGWRGSSFTQGVARFRALDSLPGSSRSWLSYCNDGLTSHSDAEALVGYYGRPCKIVGFTALPLSPGRRGGATAQSALGWYRPSVGVPETLDGRPSGVLV
eukprot:scaffold22015_cov78-Phaeocystis_antarctica.AAC.4